MLFAFQGMFKYTLFFNGLLNLFGLASAAFLFLGTIKFFIDKSTTLLWWGIVFSGILIILFNGLPIVLGWLKIFVLVPLKILGA
ncbi:MAG: hypothetical protein QXJ62_00910 [Nitrososphaeria archaeon]